MLLQTERLTIRRIKEFSILEKMNMKSATAFTPITMEVVFSN